MKKDPCIIGLYATGGTIDSELDGAHDEPVPSAYSILPLVLRQAKLVTSVHFRQICMKDSRKLSEKDLIKLVHKLSQNKTRINIVTIGTYTMSDSARFVQAKLGKATKKKVVIFTGSYRPIAGVSPSDGSFNLGFCFGVAPHLKPGVYVAMHGKVFPADDVRKDLANSKFTSIFGEK